MGNSADPVGLLFWGQREQVQRALEQTAVFLGPWWPQWLLACMSCVWQVSAGAAALCQSLWRVAQYPTSVLFGLYDRVQGLFLGPLLGRVGVRGYR